MTLPPALAANGKQDTTYAIAMVCLGNICRSPIAEVVLSAKLADAGLRVISVDSAGTGGWHVGEPIDPRAASMLDAHGYDPRRHRARQFSPSWFDAHDLVLAMDRTNLSELERISRDADDLHKISMFRSFDPAATGSLDVPDPWYGGRADFEHVLTIVERTTGALVDEFRTLI
ncbi:MAG: low molecular weight phosphotyrosine protein phosphatase [Nocardioidaceae bacterium]|nr:low molecular weight phosphotyrosine protein phosphatase [Nocardioidaceae bacterium]